MVNSVHISTSSYVPHDWRSRQKELSQDRQIINKLKSFKMKANLPKMANRSYSVSHNSSIYDKIRVRNVFGGALDLTNETLSGKIYSDYRRKCLLTDFDVHVMSDCNSDFEFLIEGCELSTARIGDPLWLYVTMNDCESDIPEQTNLASIHDLPLNSNLKLVDLEDMTKIRQNLSPKYRATLLSATIEVR